MKNWMLTAAFCLLTVASLMAQRDQTLFGHGGLNITGAWGGTQIALTSFNGELGALRGGFGGVEFNKGLLVGGGRYTSTTYNRFDQLGDTYEMSYGGVLIGYGIKSHKVVHPQATLLLGSGWMQEDGFGRDDAFIAQPAIGLEINVFRWFRVGLHGGYRVAFDDTGMLSDTFTSGFGNVSFKFGWSWGR